MSAETPTPPPAQQDAHRSPVSDGADTAALASDESGQLNLDVLHRSFDSDDKSKSELLVDPDPRFQLTNVSIVDDTQPTPAVPSTAVQLHPTQDVSRHHRHSKPVAGGVVRNPNRVWDFASLRKRQNVCMTRIVRDDVVERVEPAPSSPPGSRMEADPAGPSPLASDPPPIKHVRLVRRGDAGANRHMREPTKRPIALSPQPMRTSALAPLDAYATALTPVAVRGSSELLGDLTPILDPPGLKALTPEPVRTDAFAPNDPVTSFSPPARLKPLSEGDECRGRRDGVRPYYAARNDTLGDLPELATTEGTAAAILKLQDRERRKAQHRARRLRPLPSEVTPDPTVVAAREEAQRVPFKAQYRPPNKRQLAPIVSVPRHHNGAPVFAPARSVVLAQAVAVRDAMVHPQPVVDAAAAVDTSASAPSRNEADGTTPQRPSKRASKATTHAASPANSKASPGNASKVGKAKPDKPPKPHDPIREMVEAIPPSLRRHMNLPKSDLQRREAAVIDAKMRQFRGETLARLRAADDAVTELIEETRQREIFKLQVEAERLAAERKKREEAEAGMDGY